jgi:hypothetical protein
MKTRRNPQIPKEEILVPTKCCNYPCAGPAPLGIAVAVAIGIAGATQLRCASVEATQLGMGIGSAPEGARTQEPALERWEWRWAYGYKGTLHSTVG